MAHAHREGHRHDVSINILPDDIFREIFAFCIRDHYIDSSMTEWQRLVHVSQRWRQIIYASPRYLNLVLVCSKETPVKNLSCWPDLPIAIEYNLPYENCNEVIAPLKHRNRVYYIGLSLTISQFVKVAAVMQEPFPMLTQLELYVMLMGRHPILPSRRLLGGSAPQLKHVLLAGIQFPEFPKFLLSSRDLVSLRFDRIPLSSRISPKEMVAGLSVFTKLKTLYINFLYPGFLIEQMTRHPDPPLQAVLPVLTKFEFGGLSEYFEDLVALLDTPRLDVIRMSFDQLYSLQLPQLSQLITRTENLAFRHAQVKFGDTDVNIQLDRIDRSQWEPEPGQSRFLLCGSFGWPGAHVEHLSRVLSQLFVMFSDVSHLFIHASKDHPGWQDNVDSAEFLAFLHLFVTVETLHLSGRLACQVAHALEDIPGEMVTEVLPSLHQLVFEDHDSDGLAESTEQFVSLRQLYGHPVVVTVVDSDLDSGG